MIYGYASVSTTGQAHDGNSLDAQVNALQKAGAEKIFSGRTTKRPEFEHDMVIQRTQEGKARKG